MNIHPPVGRMDSLLRFTRQTENLPAIVKKSTRKKSAPHSYIVTCRVCL